MRGVSSVRGGIKRLLLVAVGIVLLVGSENIVCAAEISLQEENTQNVILPSVFDAREKGYVTPVKNQKG